MWNSNDIGSEGLYAVSQTLSETLRLISSNCCLDEKSQHLKEENQSWKIIMNKKFTQALLKLDQLPLDESDTILSILGGEKRGLIAGDRALTSRN